MRIALIGSGDRGKAVLDVFLARGDTVAAILWISGGSEPQEDALIRAACATGIEVVHLPGLEGPVAEQALRGLAVDIAVIAYGDEPVSAALAQIPEHGIIQAHPSLLPRYRGPSPVHWPVARGEAQTGVTIIRPTMAVHEGPVILQRTCPIGPDDTVGALWNEELSGLGAGALAEAATLILRGEHLEIAQDEDAATYEGPFGEAEAEIHWSSHAEIVHNLIRAANPEPGAWTLCDGRGLRVLDARLHTTHRRAEREGEPGEVVAAGEDGFSVCVPGGRIEVLTVRPEGGEPMPAGRFLRDGGVSVGTRLGR